MNKMHPFCGFALCIILALPMPAAAQYGNGDTDRLIRQILREVVELSLGRARQDIRGHTGIDPFRRGFGWDRDDSYYPPVSGRLPDRRRAELRRLSNEYDREMAQIERELEWEVYQARAEFQREVAREYRAHKIREKRYKLEEKVDRAYARFQRKVRAVNRRFDERRNALVSYDRRYDRGRHDHHDHRRDRRYRNHWRARHDDD
ncbi:MAG: hypothetical protein R3276_02270 [Marinobacter sp.]|nr:hypothetical protein [Marinobacter sp.]